MAGDVRLESMVGILLSDKEMREVLGRIGAGGTAFLRRSGGKAGVGESCSCQSAVSKGLRKGGICAGSGSFWFLAPPTKDGDTGVNLL